MSAGMLHQYICVHAGMLICILHAVHSVIMYWYMYTYVFML